MADKDQSSAEFNPKHRIVGAIIVVSLAVIFVPMILDERAPPVDPKAVTAMPAKTETGETRIVISSVPGPAAKDKAAGAVEPDSTKAPVAGAKRAADESRKAAREQKPQGKSPAGPAAEKAAAKPDKGWVVQVGTFSNADNAARLEEKLKAQGHKVSADNVTLDGGAKAVRLRVGPFHDRPLALKAQAQIQQEVGVQGVVLAYP